jgi:hypothetical protein
LPRSFSRRYPPLRRPAHGEEDRQEEGRDAARKRDEKATRAAAKAQQAVRAAAKAEKAAAPRDASLKGELVALAKVVARYVPNTPDEAAAYHSLASDARRSALGGETKGRDVLREAVAVAVAIDAAFRNYAATVGVHYALSRFRFLLDAISALGETLVGPVAGAKRDEATAAADALAVKARTDKKRLLRAMQSFAGQRDAEKAALERARTQTAEEADALATSIGQLATLAENWLTRTDTPSTILLGAAGLTHALVDQALASGRAYANGVSDVTLAGRRAGTDSPLVNLKEGGVLVEIIEVDHAFNALAEDTNGVIARLPLGTSLSRIARSKPKAAAKPAPASPPSEPEISNSKVIS